MDGCGEAGVSFVVSGGDAAEFLEALDAILDEMAPFVHLGIVIDARFAVGLGGNDGDRPAFVQRGAQAVVVEGLVGDQRRKIDVFNQRLSADAVMALAGQQDKAREIAQRIDQHHNLGRQPAAGAADGLIASPPFAPVPCR
jgi:lysophospholipase L1-like esterase